MAISSSVPSRHLSDFLGDEQFRLLHAVSSMAQFDPVDFNCTTVDAARNVLDALLQDLLGDLFLIEDENLLRSSACCASNPRQWTESGGSQEASVKVPSVSAHVRARYA